MPASETTDGREKAANESSDPGSRLRQAREAQGLSLEDLGNELRIGAQALGALEDNRFDALGPPVFGKGYLKQYGARLGLDVRELAAMYERAVGEAQVELEPTKGIRLRNERHVALWVAATLALVLVVVGVSYWWLRQAESAALPTAGGVASFGTAVLSPAAERADESAAESEAEADADANAERDLGSDPEPEAAAEAPAGQSDRPTEAAPPPVLAIEQAALADERATVSLPDGPALEVFFVEDSWAEILDEDGSRLFYNLGRAGTRALFPADRNLNLYFGNASGIELRIDGEDVAMPGGGRRDVVRFDLDTVID